MSLIHAVKSYFLKQDDGFEKLIGAHFDDLLRLSYRMTDQASDAEDLVQDFLLHMLQKKPALLNASNPKGFLLTSLQNLYIDRWRCQKNSPLRFAESDDMLADYETEQLLLDDDVHQQQLQERILSILPLLPPERRMVLVMHDMMGYTIPEISKDMNIAQGTLKSRLHRARATIRHELNLTDF